MKTVLYLIQAKDKFPAIYNCLRKRNFLLLSYKTQTPYTTIFAPNTTWTEGRNLLYEYVKRHNLIYDYYVFMDEDCILFPASQNSRYLFRNYRNKCIKYLTSYLLTSRKFFQIQDAGYKSLEASLELNFPIVTLLFGHYININKQLNDYRRSTQLPEGYRIHPICKKTWCFQTLPIFDAILNAVSRDAFFAGTVLPYMTDYDNTSWWISQYIFFLKANYYYRNGILQNNCYTVTSSQQSLYPKDCFTEELQWKIYKNLCKEFGVNEIKASECRRVPTQQIHNNLNNKQFAIFKYVIDILTVCMFPIVVLQKVMCFLLNLYKK